MAWAGELAWTRPPTSLMRWVISLPALPLSQTVVRLWNLTPAAAGASMALWAFTGASRKKQYTPTPHASWLVTVLATLYGAKPLGLPVIQDAWSGTSYGISDWYRYTRPPFPFQSVWYSWWCSLNRP